MQKIYNTLIVVPMKDPAKSKSRLDYSIPMEIKKRLVVKLFKNNLDSLIAATKITMQFSLSHLFTTLYNFINNTIFNSLF